MPDKTEIQANYTKTCSTGYTLKELLLRHLPRCGVYATSIEGVRIAKREEHKHQEKCFYWPLILLVVQGAKRSVMPTT